MSRKSDIMSCLQQGKTTQGDWTVAEICKAIGESHQNAKFVSSILVRAVQAGEAVKYRRRNCSLTGRTVWAFISATRGSAAQPRQRKPRASKAKAQQAQQAQPQQQAQAQQAQPQTPAQKIKADMRRKMIEDILRRKAEAAAQEAKKQELVYARRVFEKMTGYRGTSLTEAKSAYRTRVFDLHPDRGGDQEEFHRLKEAWEKIQHAMK